MVDKFSRHVKLRKGKLTQFGYDITKSPRSRHTALAKAVAKYGKNSTIDSLNYLHSVNENQQPTHATKYLQDSHWVSKTYGDE